MSKRSLALRVVCVLALAVWVGGFTFYGAAVLPTLHRLMPIREAAKVTRRVTDILNGVGGGTLAVWWLIAWLERASGTARPRRVRLGLLAATTALWLVLVVLHPVMDRQIDAGQLARFYPLHRAYLIASTAQWFANVGLLAVSLALWGRGPAPAPARPAEDILPRPPTTPAGP